VQGGLVEIAVSHGLAACNRVGAVVWRLAAAAYLLRYTEAGRRRGWGRRPPRYGSTAGEHRQKSIALILPARGQFRFGGCRFRGEAMRKKRNERRSVGLRRGRPGSRPFGAGLPAAARRARTIWLRQRSPNAASAKSRDRGGGCALRAVKSRNWPRPALSRSLQMGEAHPGP
jgi:hypothetical protein